MYRKHIIDGRLAIQLVLVVCMLIGRAGQPMVARDASAFADSILQYPQHQQVNELWKTAYPAVVDSQAYTTWYTSLEKEFKDRNQSVLAREAWMMLVEYRTWYLHLYKQYGIDLLDGYIAEARSRGWKVQEAECMIRKGLG